jgi:hypothetical protein
MRGYRALHQQIPNGGFGNTLHVNPYEDFDTIMYSVNNLDAGNSPDVFIANGNLMVGWTGGRPSRKLEVYGDTYISGSLTVANVPGATSDMYVCRDSGLMYLTTSATQCPSASSKELKENIRTLPAQMSLAAVMKLQPVIFDYKDDVMGPKDYMGFIAEDVAEVLPYAVVYDNNTVYGLRYETLIAPMVKSIQEQQGQIEELKTQNQKLSADVRELKMMVCSMAPEKCP